MGSEDNWWSRQDSNLHGLSAHNFSGYGGYQLRHMTKSVGDGSLIRNTTDAIIFQTTRPFSMSFNIPNWSHHWKSNPVIRLTKSAHYQLCFGGLKWSKWSELN
jgi:hypothetical protein